MSDAPDDFLILAFGDSLTAGYGLPRDKGFAPQLEAALRRRGVPASVINAGISGDTVAAGWARLPRTMDGLQRRPDLAVVGLGGNDMLRMVPPRVTREGMESILGEFRKREIPVLIAGMYAAPFLSRQYQAEFNAIYPGIARTFGAGLYPFFLAASPACRVSTSTTESTRTRKGLPGWWRGYCPMCCGRCPAAASGAGGAGR